jgi:hypothetical protein
MIHLTYKEERDIKLYQEYKSNKHFKKLCLVSHFSHNNKIDDYVVYMIQELYRQKYDIAFISTSKHLNAVEIHKISKYLKLFILKKNSGYDFVSWKTALSKIENYKKYEQIIHMNDSIFFPLYPLKRMFDTMKREKVNFWGLSDSYYLAYHIQSFFWVFDKKIIKSNFYKIFWNNCTDLKDKGLIIKRYEIAFTSLVLKQKYRVSSYIKIKNLYSVIQNQYKNLLPMEAYTAYYTFWDISISECNSMYLKKNILLENNFTHNIGTSVYKDVINLKTKYDSNLIACYIKENNVKKDDSYEEFNYCIEVFKKFIESQENNKKIIIYAYSHIGVLLHSIFTSRVVAIVDMNYESLSQQNKSYEIKNPNSIKDIEYDSIIVCAFGREKDILRYLNTQGIDKNIFTMRTSQSRLMQFSGNMTKLLRNIETIAVENQKNNVYIRIHKTQNHLFEYLVLYNKFMNFPPLKILNTKKYLCLNKIVFQSTNKISNSVYDSEFYPI